MKHYRDVLERFRRAPGMWIVEETFSTVTAFVQGYDAGVGGSLLEGFREWLITRSNSGTNLGWTALVVQAAFPGVSSPDDQLKAKPDGERIAIDAFFRLFAEFDERRNEVNGLKKILAAYEKTCERLGISSGRNQRPR